jgi:GMP synthase-like glutamine amidotransferase
VTPITLTSAGSSFFSSYLPSTEVYKIQEFHEREVKTPGKNFIALAEENQCFINAANTILTFQGHPEMSAELARLLLKDVPKYMGCNAAQKNALEMKIDSQHDGTALWKRIVEWAGKS